MTDLVLARTQTLTSGTALTLLGTVVAPAGPLEVALTGSGGSLAGGILAVVGLDENGDAQTENLAITSVGTHTTTNDFSSITSLTPSGAVFTGYSAQVTFDDQETAFNYDGAEDQDEFDTLLNLRRRMLRRLGYAAQALNPPPGMADLLTDFLQSAQRHWLKKFKEDNIKRFFTWVMQPDLRFYGIKNNQDLSVLRLDAYNIEWVGVEDQNLTWLPLIEGIPPEFYTSVARPGIPGRYEVNQAIEVFPAPDRPYKLRVKAGFRASSFSADNDLTSIDAELVFLWALANAKLHYGHPDADAVAGQAKGRFGAIIAGSHKNARYVPGTVPAMSATKPIFLPLENE